MNPKLHALAVAVVCFALSSGCSKKDTGSDAVTNVVGAGPLDGSWVLQSKVCNGSAVDLTGAPETSMTFANKTGVIANTVCTIQITLDYVSASEVRWTIGPYDCAGVKGAGGDVHDASYTLSGNTLTLTEEMTPPDEFGCGSGRQVSTLKRK